MNGFCNEAQPLSCYVATRTYTAICSGGRVGSSVTETRQYTSKISLADAEQKALDAAKQAARAQLVCLFTSTQRWIERCHDDLSITNEAEATATSDVSQADADMKAVDAAKAAAAAGLICSGNPALFLQNLLWLLPCISPAGPVDCSCSNLTASGAFGGVSGQVYNVRLLIRGLVEFIAYPDATFPDPEHAPHFCIGGVPGGGFNIYTLRVTAPGEDPVDYRLNSGESHDELTAITDIVTIPIKGGSTLEIIGDPQDGFEVNNWGDAVFPDTPGHPPIIPTQPYDGQFIQLNVLSVSA